MSAVDQPDHFDDDILDQFEMIMTIYYMLYCHSQSQGMHACISTWMFMSGCYAVIQWGKKI